MKGMFYPKDKDLLKKAVEDFLSKAEVDSDNEVKGLIVPHAGYAYSGQVAAYGYKLLKGLKRKKIILLGPSHSVYFRGASVARVKEYETPLGRVKVDEEKVGKLLEKEGFDFVQEAHLSEHCLEVQLPFLQVLGDVEIVPVLIGEVNEVFLEKITEGILDILDEESLIVVSSDLSHYLPYEEAVEVDKKTIKNILNFNPDVEACGKNPIAILMEVAKKKNWEVKLLKYLNSGDTSGDRSRVVGYASFAYGV